MFAHGETVTRLRATKTVDPYSQRVDQLDWTDPDSLDITGCGIADGGSTEPIEASRTPLQVDFDVITEATADITADDRLVVRGLSCVVVGQPFAWRQPFTGWAAGMVVRARIVEG